MVQDNASPDHNVGHGIHPPGHHNRVQQWMVCLGAYTDILDLFHDGLGIGWHHLE